MVLIVAGMAGTLILLNKNEQKKRALQIITGQTLSEMNESKNVDPNKRRANMAKRLQKDDDGAKAKKIRMNSIQPIWIVCNGRE